MRTSFKTVFAAALVTAALGGASTAFADSYYQGASPSPINQGHNPNYRAQKAESATTTNGSLDRGYTGSIDRTYSNSRGGYVAPRQDYTPGQGDYYQGASRP